MNRFSSHSRESTRSFIQKKLVLEIWQEHALMMNACGKSGIINDIMNICSYIKKLSKAKSVKLLICSELSMELLLIARPHLPEI